MVCRTLDYYEDNEKPFSNNGSSIGDISLNNWMDVKTFH